MRAAVVPRYGPPEVVVIRELPAPVAGPGHVLVRVHATSVNSGDARIRGARFPRGFAIPARLALGLRGPRRPVLGAVYSGVIEAVGADVTGVRVGQRVAGMTGVRMGAHAELAAVPAARLTPLPDHVSHADAAGLLFGGTTARHFLRGTAVDAPGARVLVIGASGAVGTAAVQLAALAGSEVTGVCSAANSDLVRSLGASRVIDYHVMDPTRLEDRFDVVLDTVGTLTPSTGRRLLTAGGTVGLVAADLWQTITARGQVRAGTSGERPEDMTALLGLVEAGRMTVVRAPSRPLEGVVDAYRDVDSGHKVGSAVLELVAGDQGPESESSAVAQTPSTP